MKKVIEISLASLVLIGVSGCVSNPPAQAASNRVSSFNPEKHLHNFNITVVDAKNKPIQGAVIEWELDEEWYGDPVKSKQVTGADGKASASILVMPKIEQSGFEANYVANAKYRIQANEYGLKTGEMKSTSYTSTARSRSPVLMQEIVSLIRDEDYLSDSFIHSKRYAQLREKTLTFLSAIRLHSYLNNAEIKLGGIGVQDFKGKSYFVIELKSNSAYNSQKMDRYAIAKVVFDESVRGILSPLNEKMNDSKLLYGY